MTGGGSPANLFAAIWAKNLRTPYTENEFAHDVGTMPDDAEMGSPLQPQAAIIGRFGLGKCLFPQRKVEYEYR